LRQYTRVGLPGEFSGRRVQEANIFTAFLVTAVGSLFCTLAGSFGQLVFLRFVQGAGPAM